MKQSSCGGYNPKEINSQSSHEDLKKKKGVKV